MKTIIVPTDFSPASRNACDFASQLCNKFNARLILFNSYMLPVPISEMPFVMITADELQRTTEESIGKEANRLFTEHGIEVEWIVRLGIPDDEIRDLEKEKNIDLVVMGMKASENQSKLIGSTTNAVIRKTRKPVMVIPEHVKFSEIRSLTYATDFDTETNLGCFEPLLLFVRTFGAQLQILHIIKKGNDLNASENSGKSKLEAIFGDIPHSYHNVQDDNLKEGIKKFAQQQSTDILVLVAHQHSFFERVFGTHLTKDLTSKSQIPLLILHDKA